MHQVLHKFAYKVVSLAPNKPARRVQETSSPFRRTDHATELWVTTHRVIDNTAMQEVSIAVAAEGEKAPSHDRRSASKREALRHARQSNVDRLAARQANLKSRAIKLKPLEESEQSIDTSGADDMVFNALGVPMKVARVPVIPRRDESLSDCEYRASRAHVYLYLLAPCGADLRSWAWR